MQILLVDNYDSFTNNIAHYLITAGHGISVDVVKNDDISVFASGRFEQYDAIVISPGPGNANEPSDLGICERILLTDTRPILGVCLGHQAMVRIEGGSVTRAPYPAHGLVWQATHDGSALFEGVPETLPVMRYHSWIAAHPLPETLRCTASADGMVMAVEHVSKPRWGVQFHPESIGTPSGKRILSNFLAVAGRHIEATRRQARPERHVYWHRLGNAPDIAALCEASGCHDGDCVLLESAMVEPGLSRYSYLSADLDVPSRTVTYTLETGLTSVFERGECRESGHRTIFDFLRGLDSRLHYPDGVPEFDFHGGAVGWLGYELKSDCLSIGVRAGPAPDAMFKIVDRFYAVDHLSDAIFAVVCLPQPDAAAAQRHFAKMEARLRACGSPSRPVVKHAAKPLRFEVRHDDEHYLRQIEACRQFIAAGESYELCLTNQISAKTDIDPWALYRALRSRNPAPYAAYISLGDVQVVSSSPERFLRIYGDGRIEAKPIKGTIRRGSDPTEDERLARELAESEKDRAENLMIVDLLRHDLSAVSTPGSVSVPKLAAIESYRHVHQMVSTIEGRKRPDLDCVDVILAAFPGGSMTGAPKLRSCILLDELENGPRGPYSGALGWVGYNGQIDLSIVIRTAIVRNGEVSVGCGGAITYLSDPQSELDEMKLKSRALLQAIAQTQTGDPEGYVIAPSTASQDLSQPTLQPHALEARENEYREEARDA